MMSNAQTVFDCS